MTAPSSSTSVKREIRVNPVQFVLDQRAAYAKEKHMSSAQIFEKDPDGFADYYFAQAKDYIFLLDSTMEDQEEKAFTTRWRGSLLRGMSDVDQGEITRLWKNMIKTAVVEGRVFCTKTRYGGRREIDEQRRVHRELSAFLQRHGWHEKSDVDEEEGVRRLFENGTCGLRQLESYREILQHESDLPPVGESAGRKEQLR